MAEERAISRSIVFDLVEDQRRRIGRMLAVEHIDDGAHLQIPVDALERSQLTERANFGKPITQPAINHKISASPFTSSARQRSYRSSAHGDDASPELLPQSSRNS